MFEDSLVESAALLRTHNRWAALFALAAQCAIAALVVSLPLLHPELLPTLHILPTNLAPPHAPVPPPPPIRVQIHAASASAPTAEPPAIARSTSAFRDLIHPTGPAVDAPLLPVIDLGDARSVLPPGINNAAPTGPRITVGIPAAKPSTLLRISSGVSAGNLIAPIRPVYPEIARITHTQGKVVIDAVISRAGAIESARVRSGPPMLQAAALDAVRQARYRPFLLNGQPTEVQTTITLIFTMGD